jgi:hypothetical protein
MPGDADGSNLGRKPVSYVMPVGQENGETRAVTSPTLLAATQAHRWPLCR